jgi:hypothetical protein
MTASVLDRLVHVVGIRVHAEVIPGRVAGCFTPLILLHGGMSERFIHVFPFFVFIPSCGVDLCGGVFSTLL